LTLHQNFYRAMLRTARLCHSESRWPRDPLLCADLILNEFKQIGFIVLNGCWFWT